MTQRFYVLGHNTDTGEKWEVSVPATSPEHALTTVLRRGGWAERLLSEQPFRFVVSDVPVSLP